MFTVKTLSTQSAIGENHSIAAAIGSCLSPQGSHSIVELVIDYIFNIELKIFLTDSLCDDCGDVSFNTNPRLAHMAFIKIGNCRKEQSIKMAGEMEINKATSECVIWLE